jgi:acyl-coenzyme A synthetase/AMP-(fatty) acid ligase
MAYSAELPPKSFNMTRYCLAPQAHRPADKVALIVISDPAELEPAEVWTYGALEDCALRIAAGLADLGLERGERIVIRLDNTSDYALLFFGAIAGGFVPLPASAALSAREISFFIENCDAKAIARNNSLPVGEIPPNVHVLDEDQIGDLKSNSARAPYAETAADDPAFLVYTSGTTANPKGVLHAHRSAWGRRPMYQGWYGIGPQDRMLHAGAFNWTFTLGVGLTDPWANGATTVIYNGPRDAGVWPRIIEKHDISIFAAVPGLYRQMLKYSDFEPGAMTPLRHGLIAGERLPAGLREDWQARTSKPLYEAIGMSEISTYISSSPSVPPRAGAIGKAQEGRDVAILPLESGLDPLPADDIGLIAIHRSDPGLMMGYWQRPDEEALVYRDDWFITGDLGARDADGYISHHGRADDLMNALGYRVSPNEIEQVLSDHPDILEIAAAEIEVRPDLNVIGAFMVVRDGASPSLDSVRSFAEERLAGYKVPREYVFLDALPRNPNGKVLRSQLHQFYRPPDSHG